MTDHKRLLKENTGLLLIDIDEQGLSQVSHSSELRESLSAMLQMAHLFKLPTIVVSEKDLDPTLKQELVEGDLTLKKSTFSALDDPLARETILAQPVSQWIVAGIQAHIGVFQTVRDLIQAGKGVVVLNDAIASRSIYDYSTAIAELKECGTRISSLEIVTYELLDRKSVV